MALMLAGIFTRFLLIALLMLPVSLVAAKDMVSVNEAPLRIAVASNFAPTLKQLLARYNPNQKQFLAPILIAASSGTLFLQIEHGATFDVFLSADSERPQLLSTSDLAVKDSLQTYAFGQLALWSAKGHIDSDLLVALNNNKQRLAIANPRIAPYGKAAKQVLESLQRWDDYKNRLIQGINIGQTFQQTRSQAVNLGIVSNSQLVLNNFKGVLISSHLHQPIKQQLVILKHSKKIAQAERFVTLLMSKQAQQFIVESGYASSSEISANE